MADVWVAQGAFDVAVGALAGVVVECRLAGVRVPPWIRALQAEVACWLGEWDNAHRFAEEAGHAGWRQVVACARRQWDPAGSGQLVHGDVPARWRDVLVLECLQSVGASDRAEAWKRRGQHRSRGPAESVLWRWATGSRRDAGLDLEVRRLGADGIRRWGMGRQDMLMWNGVSSLLHLVQEADDAASALQRGCQWAREYTGLDAVGFLASGGEVLACEPESARKGIAASAGEPVRYGRIQIGSVVLRGVPRDAVEARAVAGALATACAPAVRARIDELTVARAGNSLAGELLGGSPAMVALREAVARAAASAFPVLIEGESGTGKELVARGVHRLSARRDRRWAVINCAALTDELLEAELFGHTKGAFTGAVGPRAGLLEDAHEGTMFLDEVAELSPRGQAKLLRVLQEGEIRRVGENQSRRVDVRLVTATNRPLDAAVRQGLYREDLVYRLAVIRLRVPALRDRIEDVPLLAHAFWRTVSAHMSTRAVLAADGVAALCRYGWPGNVRELQNVIAALAVAGPSRGCVSARQVESVLAERAGAAACPPPSSLAVARRLCDHRVVTAALARHAGQRAAAARELGLSRQGLAKLITRLNNV
jgi:DNA-binding NtrC family response regulator